MAARARMTPDRRREVILTSARQLFAEKGLAGTSTRDLARAAGVTQPLFYHYFPSKEALYRAMLATVSDTALSEAAGVLSPPASATTLIRVVAFLIRRQVSDPTPEKEILCRHLVQSLMTDGEFANVAFRSPISLAFTKKIEECIRAAAASGDLIDNPVSPTLRSQLTRQVALSLRLFSLPFKNGAPYGLSRTALARQATWFVLRGIGLRENVLVRHFAREARRAR